MSSLLEKNSSAVRKRIEGHTFSDEGGEEYDASNFGGFGDYFRRKKVKLQNLDAEARASSGDTPQIFKGVVAHVSGYTQPPLHVLHKELVRHGAGFLQYLDSKTMATHIIASSLPPKKAVEFGKYRVVKPAWVTDSIEAGRLLPWSEYRVVDDGPRQKTIEFDGGKMFSQSPRLSQRGYREQTQNSFYTSQLQRPLSELDPREARTPFKPPPLTPKSAQIAVENIEDVDVDAMDVDSPTTELSGRQKQSASVPGGLPLLAEPVQTAFLASKPEESRSEEPNPEESRNASKARLMTSEEHNAQLLSDPRIRKSSAANPDFLKQFYSESRLHHLSTWKAELKSNLQKLAAEKGPRAKGVRRKSGSRRYIMHVDFDSFFCAVSLKRVPEYVDKPAAVAHGTGGGSEIASCNYPARAFGVKNGMWMKRALELCPDLKVLPYDFPAYEEASRLFYESIFEVGGVVQSVSIDEALIDATAEVLSATGSEGYGVSEGSIWREQEKADRIASDLRTRIKTKTGCNVSVGIGGNILLAKVALRRAKPAGQFQIKPEQVLDVLGGLKVEDLPGVAYSIGGKLEEISVRLVSDLRQTSKERLVSVLGPKTGEKLWEYARGVDHAEVGDQPIRKSVSAEVNWGIRFINQDEAEEFVRNLCKELERRLLNEGVKGKHLTMKIMRRALDAPLDPPKHLGHGKCDTFNKSVVFGVATNSAEVTGKEAVAILRSYKFSPGDLRGLGVQLTKLEPLKGPSLVAGADGSQKRISFGAMAPAPGLPTKKIVEADTIVDESSPVKARPGVAARDVASEDPIAEDPLTPRKPRVHPALALAKANEADEKARTPLNMTGTQFILPSNADPAVLAELPQDIRSRLLAQGRRPSAAVSRQASPAAKSRSESPALRDSGDIPPDIDREVFQALPEDMKAEILASYKGRGGGGQALLPQSPRKDRVIHQPPAKTAVTPTKRRGRGGGGIMGAFNRARERRHDAGAGLLQTSFVTAKSRAGGADDADADAVPELDPEFLAELPEDVRHEVIADHRRQHLAQRSGLNVELKTNNKPHYHHAADAADGPPRSETTKVLFPARPPRVSFANSGLTSLAEVKDMLTVWHRETRDEGPHRADVEVLERYLARVVLEERDMEKARRLVVWLAWVVEEGGEEGEEGEEAEEGEEGEEGDKERRGRSGWRRALHAARGAVQEAMRERGLGSMDLGEG